MRILHIDTGAEMRGGQHQVMLLMHALREAGHESLLLAPKNAPLWSAAERTGFMVRGVTPTEVWRQSKEVAMVHAHDARAHTIAAIASRRKFAVSRRVAFPPRHSFLSRWKYQKASRFLAVSHFVAAALQSAGIPGENIDVVYDGVEPPVNSGEWSAAYPAVALASRDPQKGRDLVDQAAAIAGIRVLLSDNLPDDLRRASMFVYVTRAEGLGSAALLAMNMGIPVVASSVGGLPEVLADGECGILVENDPSKIAAAMRRMLDQPGLAQSLIERGRARIADCFTKEHLLRGTLASYRRILDA